MPKLLQKGPSPHAEPEGGINPAMRRALVSLLRRLGLIGRETPPDARLIKLARDYAYCRWELPERPDGATGALETVLAPPNPELDRDIPF